MKLLPLFMLFLAIELSLVVFDVRDIETPPMYLSSGGNYSNYTTNNSLYNTGSQFTSLPGFENSSYSANYNSGYVWDGFSQWWRAGAATILITLLIGYAVFLWGSSFFFNRNDTANFAPIFILLLGVGLLPTIHLWIVLTREVGAFACDAGQAVCWLSQLTGLIIPGILYIFWVMSCLEWWSNRATT